MRRRENPWCVPEKGPTFPLVVNAAVAYPIVRRISASVGNSSGSTSGFRCTPVADFGLEVNRLGIDSFVVGPLENARSNNVPVRAWESRTGDVLRPYP